MPSFDHDRMKKHVIAGKYIHTCNYIIEWQDLACLIMNDETCNAYRLENLISFNHDQMMRIVWCVRYLNTNGKVHDCPDWMRDFVTMPASLACVLWPYSCKLYRELVHRRLQTILHIHVPVCRITLQTSSCEHLFIYFVCVNVHHQLFLVLV